ncbi:hypothetical protein R3P38DRAFT_2849463 [Favolaschia claudopus]|uniref:Uncharacterized protein n=1 Tax=Favolaschia claudopus TaxID=2862362 RepID=A0AAW0DW53_9AGAR
MSTQFTFRRRTIGRAASPPTWACYEQIHDDYDDDDDDQEDDDDSLSESASDDGDEGVEHSEDGEPEAQQQQQGAGVDDGVAHDMEMDVDAEGHMDTDPTPAEGNDDEEAPKVVPTAQSKGKQRAVDPVPPPTPKRRQRGGKKPQGQRERMYTLRPILTIQRSQGFVWNQDLFIPPYIKDRYVASTSPPNSKGFISTSVSSTNSALTDYEVEVVEIRVQEGEFDGIIP